MSDEEVKDKGEITTSAEEATEVVEPVVAEEDTVDPEALVASENSDSAESEEKENNEPMIGSLLGGTPVDARRWYVIHTYAGYEDQVAQNLQQRIASMNMEDKIFDVLVPKEKQIEIKNGKRKTVENRVFPGYVLVQMLVTEDSWFVVRNTPNVTGFIGFGTQPTPISSEEVERIKKRMGIEEPKYEIEFDEGDLVRITDGALKNFEAKVIEVDRSKGKIKVSVNMFGRETPVTLDSLQIKKL